MKNREITVGGRTGKRQRALKESRKGIVSTPHASAAAARLGHGAVGDDAVLEAVELPAGVADLHPGLTHVDAQTFTHLACSLVGLLCTSLRVLLRLLSLCTGIASAQNCDDGRLHTSQVGPRSVPEMSCRLSPISRGRQT